MKKFYKLIYGETLSSRAWLTFIGEEQEVFIMTRCFVNNSYRRLGIATWLVWEALCIMGNGFVYGFATKSDQAFAKIFNYFKFDKISVDEDIVKYFKNLKDFKIGYPEINNKLKISKPNLVRVSENLIADGIDKQLIYK